MAACHNAEDLFLAAMRYASVAKSIERDKNSVRCNGDGLTNFELVALSNAITLRIMFF